MFASWKTSLTGIASGLIGVLVLTNIIPVATGVVAHTVATTLIGVLAKDSTNNGSGK